MQPSVARLALRRHHPRRVTIRTPKGRHRRVCASGRAPTRERAPLGPRTGRVPPARSPGRSSACVTCLDDRAVILASTETGRPHPGGRQWAFASGDARGPGSWVSRGRLGCPPISARRHDTSGSGVPRTETRKPRWVAQRSTAGRVPGSVSGAPPGCPGSTSGRIGSGEASGSPLGVMSGSSRGSCGVVVMDQVYAGPARGCSPQGAGPDVSRAPAARPGATPRPRSTRPPRAPA
jgi:hypothetical protein